MLSLDGSQFNLESLAALLKSIGLQQSWGVGNNDFFINYNGTRQFEIYGNAAIAKIIEAGFKLPGHDEICKLLDIKTPATTRYCGQPSPGSGVV